MEKRIIQGIILVLFVLLGFFSNFDAIGEANDYSDSKLKVVDISNKKIFIPFHDNHFLQRWRYQPKPFEGKVTKKTYILSIINYVHGTISLVLTVLVAIFYSEVFFWSSFAFWVAWLLFLMVNSQVEERRFVKREGELTSPDFRMD